MPRIRTIKPELSQSESLGGCSRDARLLFVLMFTLADDEGRLRGAARMLASLLFPYDADAPDLVEGWIAELERAACIRRYDVDGKTYVQILNWLKHQKIDHPKPSKFPPPRDDSRSVAKVREASSSVRDEPRLDQGSRIKDQGRDRDQGPGPGPGTGGPGTGKGNGEGSRFALPNWVPAETWATWLKECRTKKQNQPHALALMLKKLSSLRDAGYDPKAVIEQSIAGGYRGLFKLDRVGAAGGGSRQAALEQRNRAVGDAILEKLK